MHLSSWLNPCCPKTAGSRLLFVLKDYLTGLSLGLYLCVRVNWSNLLGIWPSRTAVNVELLQRLRQGLPTWFIKFGCGHKDWSFVKPINIYLSVFCRLNIFCMSLFCVAFNLLLLLVSNTYFYFFINVWCPQMVQNMIFFYIHFNWYQLIPTYVVMELT